MKPPLAVEAFRAEKEESPTNSVDIENPSPPPLIMEYKIFPSKPFDPNSPKKPLFSYPDEIDDIPQANRLSKRR